VKVKTKELPRIKYDDDAFYLFFQKHSKGWAILSQACMGKGSLGYGCLSTRESVLFIGTSFSNLYTAVDTPAEAVMLCMMCLCVCV
jgi:hypothetical protein